MDNDIGLWGVPLAILGGAIRVSTPFIFLYNAYILISVLDLYVRYQSESSHY